VEEEEADAKKLAIGCVVQSALFFFAAVAAMLFLVEIRKFEY
jgi:hypothetical protein